MVAKRPGNKGKNITIVAALTIGGIFAEKSFEGAMNGEKWTEWIREDLSPILAKGDIVVVDNLSAHKNQEAIEIVENTGAKVFFLPPYSPDMNPIEFAWSKVKNRLRRIGARTKDALFEAIDVALSEVTQDDAIGWFFESLNAET